MSCNIYVLFSSLAKTISEVKYVFLWFKRKKNEYKLYELQYMMTKSMFISVKTLAECLKY